MNTEQNRQISRRNALKMGLAAGGAMMISPLGYAAEGAVGKVPCGTQFMPSLGRRKLSSLEVSSIGFGCQNIAGAYSPRTDKKDAVKLIREAYDTGATFFDTAEIYGPFYSEECVGEAFSGVRDNVIIATKIGYDITPEGKLVGISSRPDTIRRATEGCLKRLGTDYIDLLYQHRIDPNVPIEDVVDTFLSLMKEGKIKHYGLSNVGAATIHRAHAVHPVTAIQNEYSFWTRDPENEVLAACEELGIGFVPWSPLGMGYLTNTITPYMKFDPRHDRRASHHFPRFTKEAIIHNRTIVDLLTEVGRRKGATSGQIALAWLMAQKPWIVPIPGTTKTTHMKDNFGAAHVRLTKAEMQELETEFSKLTIQGKREREVLMAAYDIGINFGTSSVGTHGGTPLRK